MRRLFQSALLALAAFLLLPPGGLAACCLPGRCIPPSPMAAPCAATSLGCCRLGSARAAVVADLQPDAVPPVLAAAGDLRPAPFFALFHAFPESREFRALQPLLCTFLI